MRFCPDVCGIKRNIYRKITDNGDAGIICVCLQLCPLAIEQELYVFIHFHFFAELTSPFCAGLRSVQPYVLIRPLEPRAWIEVLFQRHEERVIRKPRFLSDESGKRLPVSGNASPGCLSEQSDPVLVKLSVIDLFRILSEIRGTYLFFRQQSVFDQDIRIHIIRTAGVRRKALIRRVSVAYRSYRKHLPAALSRGVQKVDKLPCLKTESPDPVRRRDGK